MDRIPPEILNRIFIRLDLPQRLECLFVCRSWWNVLNRRSLFYDIHVVEEENIAQFNRMMDMLEHSPKLAAQVMELHIRAYAYSRINGRRLLRIFPNTRIMRMTQFAYRPFTVRQNLRESPISDLFPFSLVSQLIQSNIGGRLKELCLNLRYTSTTVSQLKNMPVLKTLILEYSRITIDHLEELHSNIPSIENLHLNHMTVNLGKMPMDIVPAIGIKQLEFDLWHATDLRTHIQIYQYAAQKYTRITDIKYDDLALGRHYSNDKKKLYLNGLLDFYRLIGPYNKYFSIRCLPNGVDLFKALDGVGAQVKKLEFRYCEGGDILQYLSQSDQSKHVEELDILETAIDAIHFIKNMTSLAKLSLVSYGKDLQPVHLVDCLDACPSSLETLKIFCQNLVAEPFNKTLDSIETLEIRFSSPPSAIEDIISSCFPNLVDLHLNFCISRNFNITLNHPHLRKAEFCVYLGCFPVNSFFGFSLESPHYIRSRYYLFSESGGTRVEYEDIQNSPILSVVSLIETRVEINGPIIGIIRC